LGRLRLPATCIIAALALVGAGSALAATPQQIYRDLADNGRLDRRYTPAEIEQAFNLRQVLRTDQRKPTSSRRRPLLGPESDAAAQPAVLTERSGRRLPFSGIDLALLTAGGGPLLLIGAGLRRRRFGAAPSRRPGVVRG
jgi:hypothetical protein